MTRCTRILTALAISMIGLVVVPSSVSADTLPGGRVTLESPTRVIDTFSSPVTQVELPIGIVSVSVSQVDGPSLVDLQHCAASGGIDSSRSLGFAFPNLSLMRSVVVEAAGVCVVSSRPARFTVDRLGSIQAAPTATGLQFIAETRNPMAIQASGSHATTIPLDAVRPGAKGVVLRFEGHSASPGFMQPCGSFLPTFLPSLWPAGPLPEGGTMVFVPLLPSDGSLCFGSSIDTNLTVTLVGWLSPDGPDPTRLPPYLDVTSSTVHAPGLVAVPPVRVLDTRSGLGAGSAGRVAAGETLELDLSDRLSYFSESVVLNVTVTDAQYPGFVTVYPCDEDQPTASNLNYVSGETIPNLVTVPVSGDGSVCMYTSGETHLIADFAGTYEVGGGQATNPIVPTRIVDTRSGLGAPKAKLAAGTAQRFQVTGGSSGVPAGASAVTMNVTVTAPDAGGFLTVYPCDSSQPVVSNLNYSADQTIPNLVTVKLAADGSVCMVASSATHIIVDVASWFGDGNQGFHAITPTRVLDTRSGVGVSGPGPIVAGGFIGLNLSEDVPGATSVLLNVTVTEPTGAGFVTVYPYPCDRDRPTASNLNFVAGQTIPNLVSVKVEQGGVCIYTDARTHLIADLAGYVTQTGDGWFTNTLSQSPSWQTA
jgi:hypothetical protein